MKTYGEQHNAFLVFLKHVEKSNSGIADSVFIITDINALLDTAGKPDNLAGELSCPVGIQLQR